MDVEAPPSGDRGFYSYIPPPNTTPGSDPPPPQKMNGMQDTMWEEGIIDPIYNAKF
jgi:hypothetical protein